MRFCFKVLDFSSAFGSQSLASNSSGVLRTILVEKDKLDQFDMNFGGLWARVARYFHFDHRQKTEGEERGG